MFQFLISYKCPDTKTDVILDSFIAISEHSCFLPQQYFDTLDLCSVRIWKASRFRMYLHQFEVICVFAYRIGVKV